MMPALPRFFLAIVLTVPRAARGQEVFGIVRGTVSDSTGALVSAARVSLLGTAFTAVTRGDGRYAIEYVPAGRYTIRAELGEYASTERPGVVVPAGAAVRLDMRLGATAPGGRPPLAPAAEPTSRTRVAGDVLRDLPVDDPRQALTLSPGVVLRGGEIGIGAPAELALRGGPPGQASVYIDGAPARYETFGDQGIALGANALVEASVTTGVPAAFVADAGGGVIGYVTRSGGPSLSATFRADSDEPLGDGATVGYNRVEGALGGPLPGVRHLTWFLSATAQGQRSQYRGLGAADQPTYVMAGLDTVVTDTASGVGTALPRFAQASGTCGATGNPSTPPGRAIRDNYGFDCTGLIRPLDWSSSLRGHTKLLYTYGAGSSLMLTGLASDVQQRFFPGERIADPLLYGGARAWSRLAVANWSHALGRLRGGALRFNANVSIGTDREISGPLTPESEIATRDPALGLELSSLDFSGLDVFPYPITDQLIRNIRSNSPLSTPPLTPYLNRTDLNNAQNGRLNPYGMLSGGWVTSGLSTTLTLASERRLNGRWQLDWQPGGGHRISVGADGQRTDASFYHSNLLRLIELNAFIAHPRRWGVFAADRIDVGALLIDVGVRYDRFRHGGRFPRTPEFITSDPAWNPDAATDDTAYVNSVERVFAPEQAQGAVSPRVRAAYRLSDRTAVRLSYGRQVEPPSLGLEFLHVNSDLSFMNTFDVSGRAVHYGKSALVELGARHAFTPDLTLDVAVYHKDDRSHYGSRILPFVSPRQTSETLSIAVVTPVEVKQAPGVDARLEWRRGDFLGGSISYSLVRTKSFATHATTQALYAAVALQVPSEWKPGTVLGTLGRDVSAFLTFRAASGLPYTRLINDRIGATVSDGPIGRAAESLNASRLPWTKTLDLRLTKGFRSRGYAWTVYADLRNLLNFTNVVDLYSETGTTANDLFKQRLLTPERQNLLSEAGDAGAVAPDGTVDLGNCGTWGSPANCVALRRVEQRFGDGDGLYTPAEQQRAADTYFDSFFGTWRFHGPGRTVRVGMQLAF